MLLATGAIALAGALAAGGASLRSLNLSGCELTDTAAAALAGLLAPAPVEPPAAAAAGFRSPLKWRAAAAPTGGRVQLQELRLMDNQLTSAGGCKESSSLFHTARNMYVFFAKHAGNFVGALTGRR